MSSHLVIRVPGDKSISHRALIFGAIAQGDSTITGLSNGQDVRSTQCVLTQLGVRFVPGQAGLTIHGGGFDGLRASDAALDCGNSGTTMRLMMGVLAGRPFESTLVGDASLSARPMARITTPLKGMGARFQLSAQGRPPVRVHGGTLAGVEYDSPIASAQVKSAVLLAGLQAPGQTVVREPALSRDHTERMLQAMGARISADGPHIVIEPGPLQPLTRFDVPGDMSSAAFILAAGMLTRAVTVSHVGVNETRTGFLDAVAGMGAAVERRAGPSEVEPVADLTASPARLGPLELGGELLVRAIDEVPILAVLATQAHGRSVIRDAGELRVKECDRLAVTATFLNAMGARVSELEDGLIIEGPTPLRGATVAPHHDHRIAMAGAVAGLVAEGETIIKDRECASVSYPSFYDDLKQVVE